MNTTPLVFHAQQFFLVLRLNLSTEPLVDRHTATVAFGSLFKQTNKILVLLLELQDGAVRNRKEARQNHHTGCVLSMACEWPHVLPLATPGSIKQSFQKFPRTPELLFSKGNEDEENC